MGVLYCTYDVCTILQLVTCNTRYIFQTSSAVALSILFLASTLSVFAQDEYRDSVARAGERSRTLLLDELQLVRIVGCQQTSPSELIGVVSSTASEASLTRQLTLYYEDNFRRNPATPKAALDNLAKVRSDLESELRYYDPSLAREDSAAILTYLYQNGYHRASVSYDFVPSTTSSKNVLTFYIDEGTRARIDTIVYVGLDALAPDISTMIRSNRGVNKGDHFSEGAFERDVRLMVNVMRDNGYYLASYEPPIVGISEDGLHDSIVVVFTPGRRVRIDTVVFFEITGGFPSVNESTRLRQLDFQSGEWYNKSKIDQSRFNLMSLGVFDIVVIDTVSFDNLLYGSRSNDTAVTLKVFTRNSKVHDVGMNFLFYQTAVDNFLNLGVGATAQYRNSFGGAEVTSASLQYVMQDISRFAQGQQLETEILASVLVAFPNIGRLFQQRVGLQTSGYYSRRQLVDPFRLESMGISARSPITLHPHTFFNGIDLSIGLERQIPRNFDNALLDALRGATSSEDTAYVVSTFNQFLVLDDYLKNTNNLITGFLVGFTARGEHRNNPVSPTRGTFSSISVDMGWGAGKYLRTQLFLSSASLLGPRLVAATKIKLGHIQLLDFVRGDSTRSNTYVPLDRQFFAGGAASIRSFPSRRLHDPVSGTIRDADPNQQYILANVIGSGSLVELGFELRYTFPRPRDLDDLWASLIERSGLTFFTDIGNTFNRFTTDLYGSMKLEDLYKGSVVAAGIGYRFDTPVGPFRIDYATSIYDPTRNVDQWIIGRKGVMNAGNWQFSIGIGQAF